MTTATAPRPKQVALDDIRPYWRNPRTIPDEAIATVARSIERYGYVSPIVVDGDGVIIAGHTRYAALRRLGIVKASVVVLDGLTPEQAKEYRLVDNRTADLTRWDDDALILELREWESDLIGEFFPDVDLGISMLDDDNGITLDDVDEAQAAIVEVGEASGPAVVALTCPECFHTFDVDTSTL